MKANAFGHVVLTNVGPLGLELGFAPIPSPLHCIIVACTGKISKKPVVIDDKIVIRDIMSTVYTCDHRYGDAALLSQFTKIIKDMYEDPETFNPDNYKDLVAYEEIARLRKTN